MGGRTSIKVVTDAVWKDDAAMRDQLSGWTGIFSSEQEDPYSAPPPLVINGKRQNVGELTGAIGGYAAMVHGVEKSELVTVE